MLTYERNNNWLDWHIFCHNHEEHCGWQQHGDRHGHLLSTVRRQQKHQHPREKNHHTGQNDVVDVVQRPSPKHNAVVQLGIRCRKEDDDPFNWKGFKVPFTINNEIVHNSSGWHVVEIQVLHAVSPGGNLQHTLLLIPRKVSDVQWTGGLEDDGNPPSHRSIMGKCERDFIVLSLGVHISTANSQRFEGFATCFTNSRIFDKGYSRGLNMFKR